MNRLLKFFPEMTVATLAVRFFGLRKIPLLAYVRPSIIAFDSTKLVIKIPLRRRTKNHLNCMYFGALAIGADAAGGVLAMHLIQQSGHRVSLIFKSLDARFLKRAEGDVYFTCADGAGITELINKAVLSDERVEMPMNVTATVPGELGDEPVAEFTLVLSLRKRD